MANLTSVGFIVTTMTEYITLFQERWKQIFGDDMSFDDDTPQQQLVVMHSQAMSDIENVISGITSSMDIFQARGTQLDDLISWLKVFRRDAVKSSVNATASGTFGTIIPEGSIASTTLGDDFETLQDYAIGEDGTVDIYLEAIDEGPIYISSGVLNSISTQIDGWNDILNTEGGNVGRSMESDNDLRIRYFKTLDRNSTSQVISISSKLYDIENVVEVKGLENNTGADVIIDASTTLPPHSVCMIVDGGDNNEIAQTIYEQKSAGCNTFGAFNADVDVVGPEGTIYQVLKIYFHKKVAKPIKLEVEISAEDDAPLNLQQDIKQSIIDYIEGTDVFDEDNFELDGMSIGEVLHKGRLYTPCNKVRGHYVTNIRLSEQATTNWVDIIEPYCYEKITINEDDIVITVVQV